MFSNKKANMAAKKLITIIIVALVVITVLAFIFNNPILKYLKFIPHPSSSDEDFLTDYSGETDDLSEEGLKWQKVLEEYEKTKCNVDDSYKSKKTPCACFTRENFENQLSFNICYKETPYCYDKIFGCSKERKHVYKIEKPDVKNE